MEWDGKSEKPEWMRQRVCVPCNCDVCYFCQNGFTTGIAHRAKRQKVKVVYEKTGTIVWTKKCVEEAVDLDKNGCCYCKQCMRKLIGAVGEDGRKLNVKEKQKLGRWSTKGCPQPSCSEHICKECWAEGYDKHKKPKRKRG